MILVAVSNIVPKFFTVMIEGWDIKIFDINEILVVPRTIINQDIGASREPKLCYNNNY